MPEYDFMMYGQKKKQVVLGNLGCSPKLQPETPGLAFMALATPNYKPWEALVLKLYASGKQVFSRYPKPSAAMPCSQTHPTDSSKRGAHCRQEKAFLANAYSMLGQCQGMVGKMKDPECLLFVGLFRIG